MVLILPQNFKIQKSFKHYSDEFVCKDWNISVVFKFCKSCTSFKNVFNIKNTQYIKTHESEAFGIEAEAWSPAICLPLNTPPPSVVAPVSPLRTAWKTVHYIPGSLKMTSSSKISQVVTLSSLRWWSEKKAESPPSPLPVRATKGERHGFSPLRP